MKFLTRSHLLNLTLKEKRVGGKVRSLTLFSYLRLAVLIVLFVMTYVWVHMQVLKTGYEVSRLREACDRLSNQNRHLEFQLMSLSSLKQIESRGRTSLGLVIPSKDRVVFVVPDRREDGWLSAFLDKMNFFKSRTGGELDAPRKQGG